MQDDRSEAVKLEDPSPEESGIRTIRAGRISRRRSARRRAITGTPIARITLRKVRRRGLVVEEPPPSS